jgi:hypothetical protein
VAGNEGGSPDADERQVLAAGSVAGMEFSAASVAAALQRTPAEVEESCDELAQRHLFIRSLGAGEWPDRTVASRYRFVHALYQNALYQSISPARRRGFHQSIGEREEMGYGDRARDIAAELAAHFEQAGADRRAVRYLTDAADTATRRNANSEAADYVGRALDLAGFAHLGLKRHGAALRAFQEVTAQSTLMRSSLQMPLRLGLGQYWLARRQFGHAREQMQELCRLAATSGERTYLALARQGLAEAALAQRDPADARRELSEALDTIDGYEVPLAEWRVCATAARTELARGRRVAADAYWTRSTAVLDRLAASLEDDADLHRSFLAQPAVQTVLRHGHPPAPPLTVARRAQR